MISSFAPEYTNTSSLNISIGIAMIVYFRPKSNTRLASAFDLHSQLSNLSPFNKLVNISSPQSTCRDTKLIFTLYPWIVMGRKRALFEPISAHFCSMNWLAKTRLVCKPPLIGQLSEKQSALLAFYLLSNDTNYLFIEFFLLFLAVSRYHY